MYTREQKEKALAMYDATQSIAEVIRRLGYPSKQALYTWIANRDKPWQKPNGFRGVNTAEHPRHPSVNLKISAIRACFEEGNDVQLISAQIGYSRASIYAWHRRYLKEGMLGLMNTKDRKRGKLQPPADSANAAISSSDEVKQLKDQQNREIYGYRRIKSAMERLGTRVSEKVIRRLMKEMHLTVKQPRRARYSSYKGEITPAADNLIDRDFKAPRPNEKWLTDITEFGLSDGKVYLSPMIDCFDGMPVTWTIGTSPDADLVNTMLDQAIAVLPPDAKPIVHSDRGCHYRWPGWIRRMQAAGLRRSMSKKGCSPDNSACEGFFGHLKNEMFYNRSWQGIGTKQFIPILNDYLIWYREKRIKLSLHGLSPIEYRRKLGLI